MRTTLCEMRLLNDLEYLTHRVKYSSEEWEREQHSRETEREQQRERGRVLLQMSDGIGHKFDRQRKYLLQM
jgi:hypothetical protein